MHAKQWTFGLAAMAFLCFAAEEVSAYYAPEMGRFISRDPAGKHSLARIGVTKGVESVSSGGRFIDRDEMVASSFDDLADGADSAFVTSSYDPNEDPLAPYHDGMSLYQYVGSNPLVSADPSGLARDMLDCLGDCMRKYCVSSWGSGAAHGANAEANRRWGRYPRAGVGGPRPGGGTGGAGSPSTWQHRVCMRTPYSAVGKIAGRVCVVGTICEGGANIAAELYCTAICLQDPKCSDF